ncbi:MAG: nucleotide exchange factor GrpE [bacterium]
MSKKTEETKEAQVNQEEQIVQGSSFNEENNTLKIQLIRVNADFDNFKKRVTKERSEWEDLARISIIEDFLPLVDDLERALDTAQKDAAKNDLPWLQGFEIIYKNLKKSLDKMGVKEIDCSNDFDPEFHEALVNVDSKDHKLGQIVQVFNKGYIFRDRVIRHARVSVAK